MSPTRPASLPPEDLASIRRASAADLAALRGESILLTGATGFFGKWLLESLLDADREMGLGLKIGVVTRSAERALRTLAHLLPDPRVAIYEGDLSTTEIAMPPPHRRIFHLATDASADLIEREPQRMHLTIVKGMETVLEWSRQWGAERLLFSSSGAIYGKQPPETRLIEEGQAFGSDPLDSKGAYVEGKRMAEHLALLHVCEGGPEVVVARCFAFVGPHLPLGIHYAVGNFLRNALQNEPIEITGDRRTVRSYLYAADLVQQLLAVMVRGISARAYNVGSDEFHSLAEVATELQAAMAELRAEGFSDLQIPEVRVRKSDPATPAPRYVPSIDRGRAELGFAEPTGLREALKKTLRWHLSQALP